jgi:hypothetical protein
VLHERHYIEFTLALFQTAGVVLLNKPFKTRPTEGMKMKFSIRAIPAAAAMTAALIFGAQVQAQTATPPTTATGDSAAIPASPNMGAKTAAERDAKKPMAKAGTEAGATAAGAHANMPSGPNATGKTMEQRDAAKPMAKKTPMSAAAGPENTSLANGGGGDQPVRQADKISKNKAERMTKGDKPKAMMGKSNEPVRESDIKEETKK